MPKRNIITFDELCERYPFKPWTVREYCSQQRIPHLKVGRRVYFDVLKIEAWLEKHEKPVAEVHANDGMVYNTEAPGDCL
jgi:hypothetical protein